MNQRYIRKRNAIQRKGLFEGFKMGLEAAEREARMCAMSWTGSDATAAQVVADQIQKIEIPQEEVQQVVGKR